MPALLANSDVVGFIVDSSHIPNSIATPFVRTTGNDFWRCVPHNRNVARRGVPNQINWFLREWMDALGVNQAEMIRRTDWSKATTSQLYNNVQDYSPRIVNEAAAALNVAPFELLMRPDEAMALRRQREAALTIVGVSDEAGAAARLERDSESENIKVRKVRK